MKKSLFFFFASPFFLAQIPQGYYAETESLTGYQLKEKLNQIISKDVIISNYSKLIREYYGSTDLDNYYDYDYSNKTYLLDIYSEIPNGPDQYEYTTGNTTSSADVEGMGINREHMMPASTFEYFYPMYSDLFTVIPADAYINQQRSNFPYGVVGNIINNYSNGSKFGYANISGYSYTGKVYEPIDEFKGDVARSLLYYAVRYEKKLPYLKYNLNNGGQDVNPMDGTQERGFDPAYLSMLLSWHQLDPVSQREIDRNNNVFKIQGNRNPFIDNPQWVTTVWNVKGDGIAPDAPQNLTTTAGAHYVTLNWNHSTNPDILGYKVFLGSNLEFISKNNSVTIDRLNPSQKYDFTVVAYDSDFIDSPKTTISTSTIASDSYASEIFISKYLEGSDDNRAIEITNKTGHPVNLNNYRLNAQQGSGNSFYSSEGLELEGILEHNHSVVIIHPKANFDCFNTKEAGTITDSPALSFYGRGAISLIVGDNIIDALGVEDVDNRDVLENVSLYRNKGINKPNSSFNTSEWTVHSTNYCENLGSVLSTQNVINKNEIAIYPNPSSDIIFLKGKTNQIFNNVVIFDMNGKVVSSFNKIKAGDSVPVSTLQSGLYIINIDGVSYKFIKK